MTARKRHQWTTWLRLPAQNQVVSHERRQCTACGMTHERLLTRMTGGGLGLDHRYTNAAGELLVAGINRWGRRVPPCPAGKVDA